MARIILVVVIWTLLNGLMAQTMLSLEDCGVAYIDPQDAASSTTPTQDTLVYTNNFSPPNQTCSYTVDINAFGGQQIDRCRVYAILPDESLELLGALSFGNCVGCVDGFALVVQDSLLVKEVASTEVMNMWIQSLSQPAFALPGNLQTLSGVGRISGTTPPCAVGLWVEYIVFSNPQSTTTEFSTYIHCPEIVTDCRIITEARLDCQADSIYLEALIPDGCYAPNALRRWYNREGWEASSAEAARSLAGNEGWYYFSVTDESCTVVDSVLVENPPFAEAGPDQLICEGAPLALAGSGGMDHFWVFPDGSTVADSLPLVPAAGSIHRGEFVLHAFNEAGCEDTDTLLVSVHTPPAPEILYPDLCLGDTLAFIVANAEAYQSLQWTSPDGNPLSPPLIADFQPVDFGTYTLTALDTVGCVITESREVTGTVPPAFEYVIEEHCDSSRIYLFPEEYSYNWEDGSQGSLYTVYSGGAYSVTVTDAAGCSSVSQIDAPPPDGPEVDILVDQPFCPGDFGAIEIVAAEPNRPLIFSIDGGENYGVNPRYERLLPGEYTVVIQDNVGCIQEFPVALIRPDTMGVRLPEDRLEVRPLTPISLQAETIGNIQVYTWLPPEINSGTATTEFIALHNLDVRIVVEDDRGCRASAGFPLTIVLGDIFVPNAFSPNDDGFNDRFILYSDNGSGELIQYLRIFDRQGGMVFEGKEIGLNNERDGWDGSFLGKPLNPGVYTYHSIVRFGNGATKEYNGDVLLVR